MEKKLNEKGKPWDDNLEKNKEYIIEFYKKSEKEIKKQQGEGKTD